MPGEKIIFDSNVSFSSLIENLPKGGIITGIPSLKNDDEKQQFNLSSVVRSMYGREDGTGYCFDAGWSERIAKSIGQSSKL